MITFSLESSMIIGRPLGHPSWSIPSFNKGMAMNFLVGLANASYLLSYSVLDVLLLRIFAVIGGVLLIPYHSQPVLGWPLDA